METTRALLQSKVSLYIDNFHASSKIDPPENIDEEIEDIVEHIIKCYDGNFNRWLNHQKEMSKI